MRTVTLGNILPPEAFPELERLLKQPHPSIGDLKALCGKYREELLAKQVEPDYLAWVLYAKSTGAIQ